MTIVTVTQSGNTYIHGEKVTDELKFVREFEAFKEATNSMLENNSIGLGDDVAKLIKKMTFGKVTPCGGCKKRQAKLNKLFPYKGV